MPFRNIDPATQGQSFDVAAQQRLMNMLAAVLDQCEKSRQKEVFDNFYRNMVTISALGLSITFGLIVSGISDPKEISQHGRFDSSTTRILLAVSWLLFGVALNLSFSFAYTMPQKSEECQIWASKFMYVLVIAAVICLSLVVSSYVEVVGYVAVAFSIAVLLLLFSPEGKKLLN
jgi:hypothetical protein